MPPEVNASHVVLNYSITGFLVILIIILIALAMQIITLIKNANATVSSLNVTKTELDTTINKVNIMLEAEVTPTLRVLRQTIANLETTTKAVADTTAVARSFAERAAPYANKIPVATRAVATANPIASLGMKIASTLLTAVGTKVLTGLGDALSRKKTPASRPNGSSNPAPNGRRNYPALPPGRTGDELVPVESAEKRGFFKKKK